MGPTIQIGEETVITVDAKAAGQGKVTCKVSTPDGAELDVDVVENHDGTFDIYYTAPEPGKYVITIRFGGEHVPNSPFHVLVGVQSGSGVGGTWWLWWAPWGWETMISIVELGADDVHHGAGAVVNTMGLGDRDRHCGVGVMVGTMGLGDHGGHHGVGRL